MIVNSPKDIFESMFIDKSLTYMCSYCRSNNMSYVPKQKFIYNEQTFYCKKCDYILNKEYHGFCCCLNKHNHYDIGCQHNIIFWNEVTCKFTNNLIIEIETYSFQQSLRENFSLVYYKETSSDGNFIEKGKFVPFSREEYKKAYNRHQIIKFLK